VRQSIFAACIVFAFFALPAHADRDKAKSEYEEAVRRYDLNEFQTALEHFKQAGNTFLGGTGGGSGGQIFLESPAIAMSGMLTANGGAGGVATALGDPDEKQPAEDAMYGNVPAKGNLDGSNVGGNGAYGATPATTPTSGGGGGGVGRIWLRTHTTAANVTGTISPPPSTDTTL
jgi:hypothetical protein